jgi:hypothetical protein
LSARVRISGVWSPPFELDTSAWQYSVAADATGNAIAVWSGYQAGIHTRTFHHGWGWATPTTKLSASGETVKVAMNEAGKAVAGWCDNGTLVAASYSGGEWGAPFSVPKSDCCTEDLNNLAPSVSVAMAETGDAFVVGASWKSSCVYQRQANAGWSGGVLDPEFGPMAPQVAASPDGHMLAAWVHDNGNGEISLRAEAFAPATGWGPILSAGNVANMPIGIGYGSNGHAAITFNGGARLGYVTYDDSTGKLSAPAVANAKAGATPFNLRTACYPLEPQQGVTVWSQGGNEEIWGGRLGI